MQSINALLVGWLGIFIGSTAAFTWLANLLLFASWVLIFNAPKVVLYTSSIALLGMISFLKADQIVVNEAGGYSKITAYGAGYWLWVLSAVIVAVSSILFSLNLKRDK